jgi:CheY-like chemotaxis protein
MRYAPPPELCRIIHRMMEMKLEKRYQTMGEVVRDLEALDPTSRASTSGEATPVRNLTDDELYEEVFGRNRVLEAPERAGPSRSVLCVETQASIQEAFKKAFTKLGYRVFMVGDAGRAAERYQEQPSDLVVFDVDGQDEEAFEAFLAMHQKAHDQGHGLSALVILGPKQRELEDDLPLDDNLIVLHKPIKMKDVQTALVQLATAGG